MKFIIDTNGIEISKSMIEMVLENELSNPVTVKEVETLGEDELHKLACSGIERMTLANEEITATNLWKDGYRNGIDVLLSEKNIESISELLFEFIEQVILCENVSPIAQEYLIKRDELLSVEPYGDRTDLIKKLQTKYETKFIKERLTELIK